MTTFNELGTKFADLEDRVKSQTALLKNHAIPEIAEAVETAELQINAALNKAMSALNEVQSALTKSTDELRNRIASSLTSCTNGLTDTLGYADESAAETEQQDTAKAA